MKQPRIISLLIWLCVSLTVCSAAFAAGDGMYQLSETAYSWDGSDASRVKATSADYDYGYGDEGSITYNLPWSFNFYDVSYNRIVIDANGFIRFDSPSAGHSFNLATTGMGPVIAPWNSDLSSYYTGGYFVQHKTNPERVVIEWQTETYTEEGLGRPDTFEAVIFQNGGIRFDYTSFTTRSGKDSGSGISNDDGSHSVNLSAAYGNAYTLVGRSFTFVNTTPPDLIVTAPGNLVRVADITLSGSMSNGSSVSVTADTTAAIGTVTYPTATGWSCRVTGLVAGVNSFTIRASRQAGGVETVVAKNIILNPDAAPVVINSPKGFVRSSTPVLDYTEVDATVSSIKIDGASVPNLQGQPLPQLSEGAHDLTIEFTNGAVLSSFTVDTIPPALTIEAPSAAIADSSFTLNGTVESDLPVTVTVSGNAMADTVETNGTGWTCRISGLSPGLSTITASTLDEAGNGMMRTVDVTYAPTLQTSIFPASITAEQSVALHLDITNIPVATNDVQVEQLVDVNHNGIADDNDYTIRSFIVKDGTSYADPGVAGDTDGTVNGSISVTLPEYLTSALSHAPGWYLFRVVQGSNSRTTPFIVIPTLRSQSVSGFVTTGATPVPGAMLQLTDVPGRQVAFALADENGGYAIPIASPGTYLLTPFAYGHAATPATLIIGSGQQITGTNLAMTTSGFHVRGRIKNAVDGIGISGIWIFAHSATTTSAAISSADGSYDFVLPSGEYKIAVTSDSAMPNPASAGYLGVGNQALIVNLSADSNGHDIALPKATAVVSGRVLDQFGNPLAGIPVKARLNAVADSREPLSIRVSDADGIYTLPLIAGEQWTLAPDPSYAGLHNLIGTQVSPYSTITGQPTENNVTVYPVTAWIEGVVKDSDNNLLGGVEVVAGSSDPSLGTSMISSADGSYRAGVCAGSWIVDALTENTVNRSVPTQTAVLTDGQTVTLNFIADVTPPTLSINSVTSPTTASSQTISGAMEAGATLRISVNTAAVAGAISYPTATTWSCVISGLVSGINSITVTAIDSSENTTSAPVNITLTPYPDLIVTSVAVPTNAVTGQSITIPVTIRNQGNTTANSFYTMLYLSSDNAITSGDTALSSIFVASLAPGTQQTLSHTFTVPTVAAKNYYFGAIVDCDSKVGESSETNNSLAGSPTAISYGPDLIVTAVTPPSNAVTGQSITIPVTIKNQGSTTANSFYTMIYLSADSAIIGSDTALSSIFVASLAPGAQQTLNYTFTVPSVAAKNYYFGAIVDCDNRVGESSETNNSLAGSPTTISSGPDLIVTAVTPPSNAVTGQSITIPVMIKNQGSTTANSFYTMIYLSADSTITASDTALSSLFVASLAPGAQQTLTYTVTVPAVAAGNYYFGAIVDCDNRVGESSETNNSLAGSPTAISYGPDLIVTAVTPPSNAVTGQSITMPVTIKNQGSTSANYFYTTLYLSTDSAITTADSYLGNVSTMSPLAPGAQVTMNYTVVVPSVTAGNYYIGAIVDYDNRIGESSEINNSLAGSPTMIGYGPDLTITTLTPPATTTTGQQITIPVLIKNQGSTVANYFFTRLYLSMDNSITSSDTYLGEIFVSSLAPGTQQTLNYTFTTPNMASGTYYFGAITDATNTVGESDEANNTLATTATAIN